MKNKNSMALLGLLSIKPMTGYMMKQYVDKRLSHFWKTSYGQVYPTMNRFIKKGLATVESKENEKGIIAKWYSITDKGLTVLNEWMEEETLDINERDEVLLKFFLSHLLTVDEMIERAERSLEFNEGVYLSYSEYRDYMEEVTMEPTKEQLTQYLTNQKGIYLNEARIKWEKECIRSLKRLKEREQAAAQLKKEDKHEE
jgi:DNA-binding PadR family transcriptional regulator